MTTKVTKKTGKTIFSKKIERIFLSKVRDWNTYKLIVRGHILLECGTIIQVLGSKFYIVINGERKRTILKTSAAFPKVKRIISRQFSKYRVNVKESASYWRSRAVDGQHNINLFRISGISFKNNKSNFLQLAS